MTRTSASAVARSRMRGASLRRRRTAPCVPRGRRRRLEELEELAVRRQDEARARAGERLTVGLQRAPERVVLRIPAIGVGVDLDGVAVAVAAQDLRLLLRFGEDLDALPIGVGADLLALLGALGA